MTSAGDGMLCESPVMGCCAVMREDAVSKRRWQLVHAEQLT